MQVSSSQRNLAATAAVALLAAIAAMSAPPGILRTLLTLPLVLFLPGSAFLAALRLQFPDKATQATFAGGLSLSIAILLGLLLHRMNGLNIQGWTAAMAGLTILFVVLAVPSRSTAKTEVTADMSGTSKFGNLFDPANVILLGASALICVGAIGLARHHATTYRQFAFAELYMAPPSSARPRTVVLGARNMENEGKTYNVDLNVDGRLVAQWRSLPLMKGETWNAEFNLSNDQRSARAEAQLSYSTEPTRILRRVWVSIPQL